MTTAIPQRLRRRAARTREVLSKGRWQGTGRLHRRVAELEQEVQELRRLSHRLAELTDLVQELLVPAVARDDDRVRELLSRYDAGR